MYRCGLIKKLSWKSYPDTWSQPIQLATVFPVTEGKTYHPPVRVSVKPNLESLSTLTRMPTIPSPCGVTTWPLMTDTRLQEDNIHVHIAQVKEGGITECLVIDRGGTHIKFKHLPTANFPDTVFSYQDNDSKYSHYFKLKTVSVHSHILHCQILCLSEWTMKVLHYLTEKTENFIVFSTHHYRTSAYLLLQLFIIRKLCSNSLLSVGFWRFFMCPLLYDAGNRRGMSGQYKPLKREKYIN
jgi:hypothetical protein